MPIVEEPASIFRLSVGEAFAEVALYGSTVLSWHPESAPPQYSALFLSSATKPGKPYRGGVPLVFPVFGEVKDHENVPDTLKNCTRHGLCRDRDWKLGTKNDKGDTVQVSMVLTSKDYPEFKDRFPFPFSIEHTVTLTKDSLKQELHVKHDSSSDHELMSFHALFHNYIRLPSATSTASGLKGIGYKDKVAGKTVHENDQTEQGWNKVIDRVYQGGSPDIKIQSNDESDTVITLERSKSIPDTTIWNPGQEAADAMADMQSGGWKDFVCAEPGHVDSFVYLEKGKDWTCSQTMYYSTRSKLGSSAGKEKAVGATAVTGGMAAMGLNASKDSKNSSQNDENAENTSQHKGEQGGHERAKLERENEVAKQDDDKTPLSKAVETAVKNHVNDTEGPHKDKSDAEKDRAAAMVIQRNYRKYQGKREAAGMTLSPDARWGDAMGRVRLDGATKAAHGGDKNDAHSRWKRGGLMIGQLAGSPGSGLDGEGGDKGPVEGGPSLKPNAELKEAMGEGVETDDTGSDKKTEDGAPQKTESDGMIGDVPGGNEDGKVDNIRSIAKKNQHGLRLIERWTKGAQAQELSKVMEAQYWLEMIDRKHRYGSNLKHYHEAWEKDTETKDNFFKWLDEGKGKTMDVEECPRERLEKERITYLSAEQRGNYIVDIKDGKLVWRRNGKLVDTTKNRWRDLGHGKGIVELGMEERDAIRKKREERAVAKGKTLGDDDDEEGSDSSSSSSSSDEDEDDREERKQQAAHYGGDQSTSEKGKKLFSTASTWDTLLRKTIGNNTWIYVYNSRHELFIGIKQTGKFQHSSFLYGGRVLSAGLLRSKDGLLTSLSPLSGHYRAGTAHFRFFVASLQDSGVSLDHVTLSKSLLLLRGLEVYGKMNKKLKGGKKKGDKKNGNENEEEKQKIQKVPSNGQNGESMGLREKLGLKSHRSHSSGHSQSQAAATK